MALSSAAATLATAVSRNARGEGLADRGTGHCCFRSSHPGLQSSREWLGIVIADKSATQAPCTTAGEFERKRLI